MKLNVSKIKPLAGYVLVEPSEKDTVTASGIVLPTDTSEKPTYGKIIALGEGKAASKKGCSCEGEGVDLKALGLKVGDVVVYKKWGGNEIKIGDIEYQILKGEDILAKVG